MWLLGRLAPDFKTIARFRQDNPKAIKYVCARFVQFCRRAGLVSGDWVAIDGSTFQAVASRKAIWTAKRLLKERLASLEAEGITAYVASNRAVNTQGDGTLFKAEQFVYEPEQDRYRCPAGQVSTRKQQHRKKKYVLYHANASDGGVCPWQSQCTTSQQRYLTRHFYEQALQRTAKRATKAHMCWRGSIVEHPFGTLKYQIFEKPKFLMRGKEGAGTEMALGVLVYNLKRVMNIMGNQTLREQLLAE